MVGKEKRSSIPALVVVLVVVVGALIIFRPHFDDAYESALSDIDAQAGLSMKQIEAKVASDAEEQYYIARRNGSAMDACVQAMGVAAAYLQAENESKYKIWKQTEKAACAAAGLPEMP